MLIVNFDTHNYIKKLVSVGVPEKQAEIQADTLKEIIDSQLGTKKDLKEIEIELKRYIKDNETNLKRDIKEVELKMENIKKDLELKIEASKAETLKWMFGIAIAQTTLIITIIKLFK